MTLVDLYNILCQAGIPVWHYEAEQEDYPYIVYQEFGTALDIASGMVYRERTNVEISHFSKLEFDPSLDMLKKALLDKEIYFSVATTYDRENKSTLSQFEAAIARDVWYRP